MDLFQHNTRESGNNLRQRVAVAVATYVDGVFDYLAPDDMPLAPGDYVRVPFRGRQRYGIVWDAPSDAMLDCKKLKMVDAHLAHLPPMSAALRDTVARAAAYNAAPLGAMLRLAMPLMPRLEEEVQERTYTLAVEPPAFRRTPARERLLTLLDHATCTDADIDNAGISRTVLQGMVKLGVVHVGHRVSAPVMPALNPHPSRLNAAQQGAADQLIAAQDAGFQPWVLDGATGAGKTEVFFDAALHALQQGRQVLILLPEIALSTQISQRAAKRFGLPPVMWHSAQTPAAKTAALRHIMAGTARLVIGARSALFLPYKNLGMIIVDEAHDGSYKQNDQVMYHARDMAVLRAKQEAIPIVLSTATPSLETIWNIQTNRYRVLHLSRREAQAALPDVQLIPMKKERMPSGCWISPTLHAHVARTLADGLQSMLFINRRGYAPLLLCRACGFRYQCPACSAWMVHHAQKRQMLCHHCGMQVPEPSACPECGADELVDCGAGVERIEEEVRAAYPQANIMMLSGDVISSPAQMQHALARIASGEVQIIIGTQLLAKGHHFPALATVGVIDADAGLAGGDIRANEKTYQLLHQLAGRAGREQTRGTVFLQTYMPEHPLMLALTRWDRDAFLSQELTLRREAGMPPFSRLAALVIESTSEHDAQQAAQTLARCMPQIDQVRILGAAPAPLYKLRHHYRYRFLVIAPKTVNIQQVMRNWVTSASVPSSVMLKIDIDPISFL